MNQKLLITAMLFVSIVIGLNFFTILVGIRAHDDLENSKNENIGDMSDNWSRAPITAFTNCADGTDLTDAFWDGMVKGCDLHNGGLQRDGCPARDKHGNGGGIEFQAIDPIRLKKWKGIEFCGKTVPGDYFSLNIVSKSETCPSGTKKCGTIDSLDNILCVENGSDCPITSIKMTSTAPPQGSTFKTGENVYLEYSNAPVEGNIPIQFKVSEGKICADLSYRDIKREPYILETFAIRKQCENTVANTVFNDEFISLDVHELQTLYANNGIFDAFIGVHKINIASYKIPVYLLARPYIGLTKACRDQAKAIPNLLANLKQSEESTDDAQDITYGMKVTGIVVCSIIMVLSIAVVALSFKKKCYTIMATVAGVLTVAGTITLIILGFISKVKVDDAKVGIDFIASEACSDAIINASVETFFSVINASSDDLMLFIILNFINLIFFLAGTAAIGFIVFKDD